MASEDFVVIEEGNTPQKAALDRLSVLVDLFSKSLDAVNQSNILLKDELCSALSVTLQNIEPDASSSIEALVKDLESNVTGTDEIRANYTRRLCARLVAVNEEKQALLAELASLKESVAENDKELTDRLEAVAVTTKNIVSTVDKLNGSMESSSEQAIKIETMDDLQTTLMNIHDRLSNLQLKEEARAEPPSQPEGSKTDTGITVSPVMSDEMIQTTLATSHSSAQCDPAEGPTGMEVTREAEVIPTEAIPTETQPSFCAQQEEPWCPCCCQEFSSRDELESHLQDCLES